MKDDKLTSICRYEMNNIPWFLNIKTKIFYTTTNSYIT